MIKVHVPNCMNIKGSIRGFRLSSVLHVPTSLTSRLVGRPYPAYLRTLKVGAEDKDEPRDQLVIHG
jgi:hypothetical protein